MRSPRCLSSVSLSCLKTSQGEISLSLNSNSSASLVIFLDFSSRQWMVKHSLSLYKVSIEDHNAHSESKFVNLLKTSDFRETFLSGETSLRNLLLLFRRNVLCFDNSFFCLIFDGGRITILREPQRVLLLVCLLHVVLDTFSDSLFR
jgi:hypothetical protein